MKIREARIDEADALATLAERTFRDTFTSANNPEDTELHCTRAFGPEIQRREIENPDWITLVTQADGDLIAFSQLRINSRKDCVAAERPITIRHVLTHTAGVDVPRDALSEDEHCRRCDTIITAIVQGQRTTYYCKTCQT